jgi:peptide/nickel transport system substrate-binding protein
MDYGRISRRRLITHLGRTLAVVGLGAGCAERTPATSGAAALTPATTVPAQAKRRGTLVYGNTTAVLNTDPYPNNNPSNQFRGQLFNTLVNLDAKRQPVPELADSWMLSDDRLMLTLKLRQGVKFHSGRPFTAEDAKWNLEYAQDPRSKAQAGSELKGVQVIARDAYTLELKLTGPLPHIFTLLLNIVIVDPQSNLAQSAGGTGPFRLDGLKPGDEMRLVRHAEYWRTDRPYLDTVTIKAMPDASSLLAALESGRVGIAFPVPSNEVKRLQTGSTTTAAVFPGAGNHCYLASAVDPPTTDKRVRQAVGLCIDRKRYAETILFGLAEPNSIVFPKTSPVWDASLDTGEFNLDRARQALADAGQPNGFEVKIHGSRGGLPGLFQFNQILQADLAKIGIMARIDEVEENQRVAMVTEGTFSGLLDHAYGNADLDPARLFSLFPFRTESNSSRFRSEEYSRLVDAARREPDWDKRVTLYRDITRLLSDEAFILPVATPQVAYGLRKAVHGLTVTPGGPSAPYFEGVWLA